MERRCRSFLSDQEVRNLLDNIFCSSLWDKLSTEYKQYRTNFPRSDVALATVELGLLEDGYSSVYVIWKNRQGEIGYRKLAGSLRYHDNLFVDDIQIKPCELRVTVRRDGAASGRSWKRTRRIPLSRFKIRE